MKDQTLSYVQEPYELTDLIDTTKLIKKFSPKQMDIDKILDIIKRKVFKGYTFTPHHQRNSSQVIQVALISKTYIYSCHKTNYRAKGLQEGRLKH